MSSISTDASDIVVRRWHAIGDLDAAIKARAALSPTMLRDALLGMVSLALGGDLGDEVFARIRFAGAANPREHALTELATSLAGATPHVKIDGAEPPSRSWEEGAQAVLEFAAAAGVEQHGANIVLLQTDKITVVFAPASATPGEVANAIANAPDANT